MQAARLKELEQEEQQCQAPAAAELSLTSENGLIQQQQQPVQQLVQQLQQLQQPEQPHDLTKPNCSPVKAEDAVQSTPGTTDSFVLHLANALCQVVEQLCADRKQSNRV